MANLILPPGWRIPDREATPESVYFGRREFLRRLGLGAAGVGLGATGLVLPGCGDVERADPLAPEPEIPTGGTGCMANPPDEPLQTICPYGNDELYPAAVNDDYPVPYGPPTPRLEAATYNNFYEFIGNPNREHSVWAYTGPFDVRPWTVDVVGEAEVTGRFDIEDLERHFGLEERVYRLRCVEAWSIVVPWTGYPLSKLIQHFRPLSSARYVRFISFSRPAQAVGQRNQPWYPWPYYEALRMDEALNELAFVATGVFGEPLPKQHGAPWRLALPWKYGFKSAKSMVRIEFLEELPPAAVTFWADVWPEAYGFYSLVNPLVPHPRWSQATETPLGTSETIPTRVYNGYREWVEHMYNPELLTYVS
jgi:methionine sulfoxide reductase catalytic subunit